MNSFGKIFRLTDFGESHGAAMGGVLDGAPAGLTLDLEAVQRKLDCRRPGTNPLSSPRKESDRVQWLSGLSEQNVTLGTPIGFIVPNIDARSSDYEHLRHVNRPGHADFTTFAKFGIREHRGGGRASARQTLCRVVGGAVAMQFLNYYGIEIRAFVSGVGPLQMADPYARFPEEREISESIANCPDHELSTKIVDYIKNEIIGKDSVGGRVSMICRGCTAGLGAPVYDKLNASLAMALMGINGAKGVEFGIGMKAATLTGKEAIDEYLPCEYEPLKLHTHNNKAGGIEGGISTGGDICLSVAFKPTPTRPYAVNGISDDGQQTTIEAHGRHDPCIAIRACAVVEAMAAMTILDHLLLNRTVRL